MVAYKTGSFQRILKLLDPSCRAGLVYGPDAGLVAERAATLTDAFAGKRKGAVEVVRLDDKDLAEDPARLEVELRTIPMFADGKVVRVAPGARLDVPMLKTLLDAPLAGALVIEAGALRPNSALRKLFEGHKTAAALPSYSDERSVSELIDEELDRANLKIDNETRSYLMARLGADQAMSRAEVAKLALYAADRGSVTVGDVDAIVGDSAEIAVENFVYDVSAGETKEALYELTRTRSFRHRVFGRAFCARASLHPASPHRFGASRRRRAGAGAPVAPPASAFQAREGLHRRQSPHRRAAPARGAAADPGGGEARAAQSRP